MNTERITLVRRSGLAAVLGATLAAAGIAAELVHPVEDGSSIVSLPLFLTYVGVYGVGMALLTVALADIRTLHRDADADVGRVGRWGFRLAMLGTATNAVFATVMVVGALATRETIGPAFLLFALGFLALIVGQVLLSIGLRRGGLLGPGWTAPLAGVAAAAVTITVAADPYHDIGLFAFFGSWAALGLAVLSATRITRPTRLSSRPDPDPA